MIIRERGNRVAQERKSDRGVVWGIDYDDQVPWKKSISFFRSTLMDSIDNLFDLKIRMPFMDFWLGGRYWLPFPCNQWRPSFGTFRFLMEKKMSELFINPFDQKSRGFHGWKNQDRFDDHTMLNSWLGPNSWVSRGIHPLFKYEWDQLNAESPLHPASPEPPQAMKSSELSSTSQSCTFLH